MSLFYRFEYLLFIAGCTMAAVSSPSDSGVSDYSLPASASAFNEGRSEGHELHIGGKLGSCIKKRTSSGSSSAASVCGRKPKQQSLYLTVLELFGSIITVDNIVRDGVKVRDS